MVSWRRLASLFGDEALSIGTVQVRCDGNPKETACGNLVLEQFGNTTLFRLLVLEDASSTSISSSFCLPPDIKWVVSLPKKVKSSNSGLKALRIAITLPHTKEGFDSITVTLPYDGESGSARNFVEALAYATSEAYDSVRQTT
ncbi:hypothetical protein SEMRO_323_G117390.1 [Seminavis robusta]|uniref:Uncharacterized protein n=1 Tax=Seminavis robusta TaxID=568900 RepID=A0A9N8DRS5_9STRA|nr:hypothetical protein SEMRO_323_G117390.1 [Seminavis robusta]|eukprot:Sro323_g117390.1 n/a (143) ;mRNA; r:68987-69415